MSGSLAVPPKGKEVVLSRQSVLARMQADDREFLPSALEIIETPASPVAMSLIVVMAAMVVSAIAWACIGTTDIIAIASGKVQPVGNVKVIQPLEAGKITVLKAANGQQVAKGDILLQLENATAVADQTGLRESLMSINAETARRRSAISAARTYQFQDAPDILWPSEITQNIRLREELVYRSDLSQLLSTVTSMVAQQRQRTAQIKRLESTITSRRDLITTLQQRVDIRTSLVQRDAGTKSALIDAVQAIKEEKARAADEEGQLNEAEATLDIVTSDLKRAIDDFIATNATAIAQAERRRGEVEQELAKANAREGYTTLVSPIDGIVTGLAITTVGQVVPSGMELMRVVPASAMLEVEAYLPNRDIGFVEVGQDAVIKLDAFPYAQYGGVEGSVQNISTDAISTTDATQRESSPTSSAPLLGRGGAQRVTNLVYPVNFSLKSASIDVRGKPVPLVSGMTVSVEIRTGSRRIIDYILSPLFDAASQSMRER